MPKLIVLVSLMLTLGVNNSIAQNQDIVREGNTFVAKSKKSAKAEPKQTKYQYTDSDGKTYPIYMGPSGACYIIRTSKKSGKQYKKYLGKEVSSQVCKEEYKSKESKDTALH